MIRAQNLKKEYEEFTLNIPEFSLAKGEILALVGENGAGKTTLIRCLTNIIRDYSGEIFVDGQLYTGIQKNLTSRIAYMSEEIKLIEDLSVKDHLELGRHLAFNWDEDESRRLVEVLKVKTSARVKKLSRGNRVKLGVILALARRPEILILDEPTSGLDPIIRELVLGEIKHQKESGTAILVSSHLLDDIESTADRISIIKNGQIIEDLMITDYREGGLKNRVLTLLGGEEGS